MKKHLLFWMLGVAGASVATAAVNPVSISPANYTVLIGQKEGVNAIDILFDGAESVTINEGVAINAGLGSAYSALPVTTSSTYIATLEAEPIAGGFRINVVGSDYFGGNDGWFTYSAGTSNLNFNIPEGFVTIHHADGTTEDNAGIGIRYGFDNVHKVNPIGIEDGQTYTADQILDLVFPESITLGSNVPAYAAGVRLYKDGETYADACKQVQVTEADGVTRGGAFSLSLGSDGLVHGKWTGSVSDIEPGNYRIIVFSTMTFKCDGVDQKGQWSYPITISALPASEVSFSCEYEPLNGIYFPEMAINCGGAKVNLVQGMNVTATIEDKVYNLNVAEDGTLTFSDSDKAAITAERMNQPEYILTLSAPEGALVLEKDGVRQNNAAVETSFPMRLYKGIDSTELDGKYYLKYWIGTDTGYAGGSLENPQPFVAHGSTADLLTTAWMSNFPSTTAITATNLFDNGMSAEIVCGQDRRYIRAEYFPLDESNDVCLSFEHPYISATIDNNLDLVFGKFQIVKSGGTVLMTDARAVYTRYVDNVKPGVPTLAIEYDYENDCIVAVTTMSTHGSDTASGEAVDLNSLTAVTVECDGLEAAVSNFEVKPGQTVRTVILRNPEPATYTFRARAELCDTNGEWTDAVVYEYAPFANDDVNHNYYVTKFTGSHTDVYGATAFDIPTGSYSKKNFNVEVEVGEVVNGKADILVRDLLPGFSPAGVLDVVTHEITFSLGYEDEYPNDRLFEEQTTYMVLVAGNGRSLQLTAPKGKIEDGVLHFDNWTLILPGETSNNIIFHGNSVAAVVNPEYPTAAPEITISATEGANGKFVVNGEVTLPTTFANGKPLSHGSDGLNAIYVYRDVLEVDAEVDAMDPDMFDSLSLIKSAKKLNLGDVVTFTDNTFEVDTRYLYIVLMEYIDHLNYDEVGYAPLFLSGIENVFGDKLDKKVNVYNLNGVKVLRDASSADLRTLPAGIYIVGGVKVAICR